MPLILFISPMAGGAQCSVRTPDQTNPRFVENMWNLQFMDSFNGIKIIEFILH